MKRALVLTSEAAGHPFRRTLKPHILRVPQPDPLPDARASDPRNPDRGWWRQEDTHLFAISFAAFFTAIYGFIA